MRSPSRSASARRLSTRQPGPLGQRHAVGRGVERPAAPAARQGLGGAEADVVLRAVVQVDAAAAAPAHWSPTVSSLQAMSSGDQHRRARRVDRQVLAAEVEAVGDPAGDDRGEHAGQAVLGQLGQEGIELGRQARRGGCRGCAAAGAAGSRRAGRRRRRIRWRRRPRRARGRRPAVPVAGVVEGVGRRLEGHELGGVDAGEAGGRDAPAQGVEAHVRDEAAPLRHGHRVPARRRWAELSWSGS